MQKAPVLLVSSSFLPGRGGIESYLAKLCDELKPEIAVLAAARRDGRDLPTDLGYRTIGFSGRFLFPGPRALRAIVSSATELGTDRVLFGTPWPLGLLGPGLKKRNFRYSLIVHGAELLVPAAIPVLHAAIVRALREADVLLTVSDATKRAVDRLLDHSNGRKPPVEVLRPRIDLERFRPGLDVAPLRRRHGLDGKRVILCLGRLVPRKGIDRLIEIMPELSRRFPDLILVVAGTGPQERRLRNLAHRRRVPVVFTGAVANRDVPLYHALAEIFVLPVADRWFGLDTEGLGVVLLEAAATGTPAVSGISGGTPEAVIDGVTGRVIDARDRGALLDTIALLLEGPDATAHMGAAARRHVTEHFAPGRLPASFSRWLEGSRDEAT